MAVNAGNPDSTLTEPIHREARRAFKMKCTVELENGKLCGKSEIVTFTCVECGELTTVAGLCSDHRPKEELKCHDPLCGATLNAEGDRVGK